MSDVKVQQKQPLSRREAARFISGLGRAAGEREGRRRLGNSTLELSVADQVDWHVEVDGDKIELELELGGSTSGRAFTVGAEDELRGRRVPGSAA